MKKIIALIFFGLWCGVASAGDYSNNVFQNAGNITRGTLPNERLDHSSVAFKDELNVSTASVDSLWKSANSTFTYLTTLQSVIAADTTTLKTRSDNLDISTQAIFIFLGYMTTDTTTIKTRIDDHDIFRSTAQPKIDSWTLSQTTISSRLTNVETNISTGFHSGGSTFTTINTNRITFADGTYYTSATFSGGGTGGSGKQYYRYVVSDGITAGASSVDCASNTLSCINDGITAIGNNYGSIRVLVGTYTVMSHHTVPSVPKNITIDFEKGARIDATQNSNVIINSGTINNIWINYTSNWAGNYGVWQRNDGLINGYKMTGTLGYNSAVTDWGALTFRESTGTLTKNIDVDVQTNQSAGKTFPINYSNSTGAVVDGGRYNIPSSKLTSFGMSNAFYNQLRNVKLTGQLETALFFGRFKISTGTVIEFNTFNDSGGGAGQGNLFNGDGYGYLSSNIQVVNNKFIATTKTNTVGIFLNDESRNWKINNNDFTGYATAVDLNGGAINTKVHNNATNGCDTGLDDTGTGTVASDNTP